MAYTIPVEFYKLLEEKVGKETASQLVEVLEKSIENSINEGFEKQKISISEDLKKELASKYDIEVIKKEIELAKKELENKISKVEGRVDKLDLEIQMLRKELRFMFIILLVIVIAINQNSLEFIAKIFGVIK